MSNENRIIIKFGSLQKGDSFLVYPHQGGPEISFVKTDNKQARNLVTAAFKNFRKDKLVEIVKTNKKENPTIVKPLPIEKKQPKRRILRSLYVVLSFLLIAGAAVYIIFLMNSIESLDSKILAINSEIKNKDITNERLKEDIKIYKNEKTILTTDNLKLEEKILSYENELNSIELNESKKIDSFAVEKDEYVQAIAKLTHKLNNKSAFELYYKRKIEQYKIQIEKTDAEIVVLAKSGSALRKQLISLEEQCANSNQSDQSKEMCDKKENIKLLLQEIDDNQKYLRNTKVKYLGSIKILALKLSDL